MKLKMDDAGHVVVSDGKPVYVHDDGKEVAFDAPATVAKIGQLNGEAKGHRERAEAAEGKLKGFEGIDDPVAAKKALETIANLDAGQLVTAGKVEEIKAAAKKAAEDQVAAAAKASNEKIAELTKDRDGLQSALFTEKVGGAFSRSKYITDKIAVPSDMVQAMFGNRFKVENGKIIGIGADNQPIYSRSKAGEIADFDEALESMVDGYAQRDHILKGTGNQGDAARQGNNSNNNSGKTLTRAAYDALSPVDRGAKMKEGYTLVD